MAFIHSFVKPKTTTFPTAVVQGNPPAQIDYQRVAQIIQQQLATLPAPQNGTPGIPGIPGQNGINGVPGTGGVPGKDGTNGIDGRTPEVRSNPMTGDIEWHYVGDRLWTILVPKCSLIINCESP